MSEANKKVNEEANKKGEVAAVSLGWTPDRAGARLTALQALAPTHAMTVIEVVDAVITAGPS